MSVAIVNTVDFNTDDIDIKSTITLVITNENFMFSLFKMTLNYCMIHTCTKWTAGMTVKHIMCYYWRQTKQSLPKKSVTSTKSLFKLIYLWYIQGIRGNPAGVPPSLLAGKANEMQSHAWPRVQSISYTPIHFCSLSVNTKWRCMGNLTCTAKQNGWDCCGASVAVQV